MGYDVVVVGEPLLEFSAEQPLGQAETFTLSFSGDALNSAVAAAAAGAEVALLTRLGEDELADRMVAFLQERGVSTALITREAGQTGAYVLGADPLGERAFAYLRAGSAASRMRPSDVDVSGLSGAKSLLLSGITAALSESCAATVLHAAQRFHAAGATVVYDPNFRSRLTTSERAAAFLAAIAPSVSVAIPSAPGDTLPLLGSTDPAACAIAVRRLGAAECVVTCGSDGVLVNGLMLPVIPAPRLVDATGAGDCFAGTLTARLALGDDLVTAVRLGMAAASLSLGGRGGTGMVPTMAQVRRHLTSETA